MDGVDEVAIHGQVAAGIARQIQRLDIRRRLGKWRGVTAQVFLQRRVEPIDRQVVADQLNRGAVAHDLDATRCASLARAGGDIPRRAIRVLQHRLEGVFALDIVIQRANPAPYLLRFTGQMAQQIERVRRLVQQDSTALAFPRPAPRRQLVVRKRAQPRFDHQHAHQSADLAIVNQRLGALDNRLKALLKVDRQNLPGGVGRGNHAVASGDLDRHWLLGQHMRARGKRIDGHRRVERVRRADADHIRFDRREQFVPIGEERATALSALSDFRRARCAGFGVDVAHGDDLRIRHLLNRVNVVCGDDAAASDDGESQWFSFRVHTGSLSNQLIC